MVYIVVADVVVVVEEGGGGGYFRESNYEKGYTVQKWHFSERCVGCRWYNLCKKEANDNHTLSQIPHIEREQKEWLESFVKKKMAGVAESHSNALGVDLDECEDIESLSICLEQLELNENNSPSTSLEERKFLNASLGVKFDRLGMLTGESPKLRALKQYNEHKNDEDNHWKKGVCYPTGTYSLNIPKEEDWGIFIAMPKDLRSDRVYSYCITTRSSANSEGVDSEL